MADSSFAALANHPEPVNRQSVVVGFFRGEHFDVEFTSERPKRRLTLEAPPYPRERPVQAVDYTGLRNGRMTAFAWQRPSNSGGRTVWVARCDCGRYEFRRPGSWAVHGNSNDMCEICEREAEMLAGPSSKKLAPERLMKWVNKLRAIGLSDDEITLVRLGDIETSGKSAAQIRADLARISAHG